MKKSASFRPAAVLFFFNLLVLTFASTACGQTESRKTRSETSQTAIVETKKPYLFYLHGRIIEDKGEGAVSEEFGKYEYKKILKVFEDAGFKVISEQRPKDTDVNQYSQKLADEIGELIKKGVAPEKITVVGASKGSLIAMLTSTKLADKNVKFVIMANCNKWVQDNFELDLHGKILSIYEKSDTKGGETCEAIKTNSKGISQYKEVQINTNLNHGFLYKPLKEWLEPAIEWAKN